MHAARTIRIPEAEQTRALTRALVEWVTKGTPPPASRYPTLANGDLVPATRAAIGMPDIPGCRSTIAC